MPIKFPYTLLEDRVVILPDATEEKTETGLMIPKSAQRRSTFGTVIAVGPGYVARETGVLIKMFVSVGDRVIYTKHEFEDFEGFVLGRESSIKCITT